MSAQSLGSIFANDPRRSKTGAKDGKAAGKKEDVSSIIDDFQSDTAAIEARRDPLMARMTLRLLGMLLICLVAWASLSTLDKIVSTSGKIVSTVPSIVLQPLETSIIKTMNVKEGDVVRAGQVLATLDPTFTQADVAQLEAQMATLEAQLARLEAERAQIPLVIDEKTASTQLLLQYELWKERQLLYRAQLLGYEEKIARAQAHLKNIESERSHFSQRREVVREIEGMRESLAAAQVGSKLNSLLATDTRIEIERNLAQAENELNTTDHELRSLRADRDAFIQQWQSRIVEEMVTRRADRAGASEQLVKARKRKELVALTATEDAVVLELGAQSVGSIARAAEPLIKLVPLNAPVEIESEIPASDIGTIKVGDPVQIKLAAYSFLEHGMMDGRVAVISEDAFTSKDGRAVQTPYYRARIKIESHDGLYNMPDTFRLIPGMPVAAEIRVGERTVLSYFMRPILRGMSEGLREP